MKHMEDEREDMRNELIEMWNLVYNQLKDAGDSLLNNDADLAREVTMRERRVNTFELKIDSDCENYIALYSPVAIDLRCVLALLRINGALERIGDFANGIARYVLDSYDAQVDDLLEEIEMREFFNDLKLMLDSTKKVFVSTNTDSLEQLYAMDDNVHKRYHTALNKIALYINHHTDEAANCISLAILTRKMERIGDHCSNIIEDIIFYIDAKVIKHEKSVKPQ
jgi:phosphate transport system protein